MSINDILYQLLLSLHNLLRWVVVIVSIFAIVRAVRGWLGRSTWAAADDRAGMLFVSLFDVQVLVGVILYIFFSKEGAISLANLGQSLSVPDNFFFGLVHWIAMIIALGLAHAGRAMTRRLVDGAAKFKRAALMFGISTLVVIAAIPWEGLDSYGRPLFRLFGFTF